MLRVEALEVAYGKIQALWGINVEIPEGEIVAVVGANGAGKTTMLKTLSGLLRPMAGRIALDDRRIDLLSPAEIVGLGVVHVPEGRKLFPEMTVLDNLLVGGYPAGARSRRPSGSSTCSPCSPVSRSAAVSSRARCREASSRWSPSAAG